MLIIIILAIFILFSYIHLKFALIHYYYGFIAHTELIAHQRNMKRMIILTSNTNIINDPITMPATSPTDKPSSSLDSVVATVGGTSRPTLAIAKFSLTYRSLPLCNGERQSKYIKW